jgi:hypothetical protein
MQLSLWDEFLSVGALIDGDECFCKKKTWERVQSIPFCKNSLLF